MIINFDNIGGGGGGGYTLPTASQNTKGGVKVGSGLTMSGETMSIKAGDGLAFSGDTLIASGSTYVLPTASENTLGGVKIGSGITIDANGAISARGGGDYMVVSGLPQSAQEGQLFYVPAHETQRSVNIYTFDCSGWEGDEGFVIPMEALAGKNLYYSSGEFYWDWDNYGGSDWHTIEGWGDYRIDFENHIFEAALDGEYDFSESVHAGVAYSTGTTAVTETVLSATYRYEGSAFNKVLGVIALDEAGAFGVLRGIEANGGDITGYILTYQGKPVKNQGYTDDGDNMYYTFSTLAEVEFTIGTPFIRSSWWKLFSDGRIEYMDPQFESVPNAYSIPLTVTMAIDFSAQTLDTRGFWVRAAYDSQQYGRNNFVVGIYDDGKIVGYTQTIWFRQAWDPNANDWTDINSEADSRIFGCEFYHNGDKIVAEWVVSGEGAPRGSGPLNWVVTQNVHSAQDSSIPSEE